MILGYGFYEAAALFFVYAFLGWCVEVIYCGLSEGHFINRGFLNGPVCPIYGVGGVAVVLCLTPVSGNLPLLFACSALLTSFLELITGFTLDKIFHARWWDYTDLPFNLGGYICLKYSVYWGLVCIALMRFLHPVVIGLIRVFPRVAGIILLALFAAVFIADIVITVMTIVKLNKRIRLMDEIAKKIHAVSDQIGERVYDSAAAAVDKGRELSESESAKRMKQKSEEIRVHYEQEVEKLKERYNDAAKEHHIFERRLLRAFPSLNMRKTTCISTSSRK